MCVVSMVGDHYTDKWGNNHWFPSTPQWPSTSPGSIPLPGSTPYPAVILTEPQITKAEFDALKKDVLEMKELLKRAIKYDQDNNEPDCHIDEKMEVLRKVADMVGVDLDDVIGKPKKVLLAE